MPKSTVLKFVLKNSGNLRDITLDIRERFHREDGRRLLNRTTWRGKEPRTCGVSDVHGDGSTTTIEVSYRPKGYINYDGTARYDGWDFAPVEKMRDGTLLDETGQPLEEGKPVVFGCHQIYPDTDFNDLDFGDFIGEFDVKELTRTTYDEVMAEAAKSSFGITCRADFVAPRRSRPLKKIILSNMESGDGVDGFGTCIRNISLSTPHLETVLMDEVSQLIYDYIEGRVSLKTVNAEGMTYVSLSDSLVNCAPNEIGLDSFFDVLNLYTPVTFLEDLAKRIESQYAVEVSIIEGKGCGFVLRRTKST